MHYLPPQILHGAHRATDAEINAHAELFVKRLAHYPDWCQQLAAPEVGDEEAVALDERPPMFSAVTLDGGSDE
jgi:glutathione-regulated potassium-efflux system ancillary protein KefF